LPLSAQLADACFDIDAAIHVLCDRAIFAARNIAEMMAAPFHAHRIAVMRIVSFAHERERIAGFHFVPQQVRLVELKSSERRALHEHADFSGLRGDLRCRQRCDNKRAHYQTR
jgi:hypothetical protein